LRKTYTIKQDLAEFLGVIDPHNNQAVSVLTEIMNCTEHSMTQIDIAQSLWIADQGNLNAISRFLDCLESKDHVIQDHAAYVVRESKIYSYEIIEKLISVLQRNKQKLTFELREVLRAIEAVGRSDRYIIDSIIELIEIHRKEESFQDVYVLIWTLGEIGFKDSKSSKYFLDLLKKVDDVASRCYIADGLGKTDASDQGVIDTLIALTSQNEHEWTRQQAAASLLRIDPTNVGCLDLIINLLKTTESWRTQAKIVDSIEQTSFGNSIAINRLEDFLENCFNNYVKKKTAISLGKINPGNAKAISTLLQILRDSNNSPRANDDIVWNLGEIGKNNLEVVRMLIQLFERKYDSENDLINHLHERNLSFASRSLCKAATQPMYRTVVENLKRYLSDENFKSHFEQFKAAYESIWHCAENMNYQDFYQAWHSSPCVELPNN
jgi:HEAT repeat protein